METLQNTPSTTSDKKHYTTILSTSDIFQKINQLTSKMAFEPRDIINAIPSFNGEEKEIESFINTCSLYNQLLPDEQKELLFTKVKAIKAKLYGDALSKMQPIKGLNTWNDIEKRIKQKLRRPISYEFAHEALSSINQNRDEDIESFGKRIKEKLSDLNTASRSIAGNENEIQILNKTHEKLAIKKFEQNIKNNDIRIMVSSTNKSNIDDSIAFALENELLYKNNNVKRCSYCQNIGHNEIECRKKKFETKNQTKEFNNNNQTSRYSNYNRNQNQDNSASFQRPMDNKFTYNRPNFKNRPNYNNFSNANRSINNQNIPSISNQTFRIETLFQTLTAVGTCQIKLLLTIILLINHLPITTNVITTIITELILEIILIFATIIIMAETTEVLV